MSRLRLSRIFPSKTPSRSRSSAKQFLLGHLRVVGPRGAILGLQDGSFEAWIFPWKIFSNLRISAEMKDYPVPIDVNEQAAAIEVRPDHTTITFCARELHGARSSVCTSQCARRSWGSGIFSGRGRAAHDADVSVHSRDEAHVARVL